MLLLRSKRFYRNLIELDPITGIHRKLSALEGATKPVKINGFFDDLDGTFVAIYVFSSQLSLMVGSEIINIIEDVVVTVSGPVTTRLLRVSDGSGERALVVYAADKIQQFENDPTPFIEKEDFDFGLFVSNIAASTERRRLALEVWQ